MDEMGPIIDEFLTESYENLDRLDQDLVTLETQPQEPDLLASIFRTIHTLKGTCGFLGYSKLESIAHVGENLLSKLRDMELDVTPETITGLLNMGDSIRQILDCIQQDRDEGNVDYSELVETLTRLHNGEKVAVQPVEGNDAPSNGGASGNGVATEADGKVNQVNDDPNPPGDSEPVPAVPASGAADSGPSILAEAGGESAVHPLIPVLLERILSDKELVHLFQTIDLLSWLNTHKAIIAELMEVGKVTPMESMTVINTAVKGRGLESKHVDAILNHFNDVLVDQSIAETVIEQVMPLYVAQSETIFGVPASGASASPVEANLPVETKAPEKQAEAEPKKQEGDTAPKGTAPAQAEGRKPAESRQANENIRVDVHLLDNLMNLVGELVLARNQLIQYATAASEGDSGFSQTSQHLNQLTSELQEGVMKTRMQPIGNIWDKFPRVVRDLSMTCGKKVKLEMEGKETELDKTLIEAIKDPLTHIVRNSVDHGIEMPDVREGKGKVPEGTLNLRAFHEGGQVIVEIKDDGAGIDPEKIKRKALDKNVITEQQAAKMGERELVSLVFHPGFSTAEKVSNISGRGVGMDVVKTNIEKIGGTVDIQSKPDEGTTLRVKIPLTLAIIPALVITCGGGRYCIPQVNLLELVRIDPEQDERKIETIQGTPVIRLRGNLLPLAYLREELELGSRASVSGAINIVVLQADNRQFGLVVDQICDTEEIVVKPLGKQLNGITAYAGATIMGDGKVALILDVMGLAQKARVISEQSVAKSHQAELAEAAQSSMGERQTLLVFSVADKGRMAVALSMVARLEEIQTDSIERTQDREVVQYRGEIMPLLYLSRLFGYETDTKDKKVLEVIVYNDGSRSIGLVVDHIIDIVDEVVNIKPDATRQWILGSAVIQSKVTELLDFEGLLEDGSVLNNRQQLIPEMV